MTFQLFLDSNILLNFYSTSSEDLEELRKIVGLISNDEIKLHLNSHLRDEFYRNRDDKLEDFLSTFSKVQFPNIGVPAFMSDYDSLPEIRRRVSEAKKLHSDMLNKARSEAQNQTTQADLLIKDLFRLAPVIAIEEATYLRAERRALLGNPPGKGTGVGDRIHWEFLLKEAPVHSILHFVSRDGDFLAPDKLKMNSFLSEEWATVKRGEIFVHGSLQKFLAENFAHIRFSTDIDRISKIRRLVQSKNYSNTHVAIAALMPLIDQLEVSEQREIMDAALDNSQIYGIGKDADVRDFFARLLAPYLDELEGEDAWHFNHFFGIGFNPREYEIDETDPDPND